MQLTTFIVKSTLCSLLLYLTNAIPTGDHGKNERAGDGQTYHRYSREEEQFIIDELIRYPGHKLPIWGPKIWALMAENYNQIRASNPSNYPPRSPKALSSHFCQIMLRSKGIVPLPDMLKGRLPLIRNENQGQDSNSAHHTNNEEIRLISDDEEVVPGSKTTLREFFSLGNISKEDQFVMRLAVSYSRRGPLCVSSWNTIADHLRKIRTLNPSQFPHGERSAKALRGRFQRILDKFTNLSRQDTKGTMEEDVVENASDSSKRKRLRYTKAEDEFIIEEMLKPTFTAHGGSLRWEKIRLAHDEKVRSQIPGFEQYRTAEGLRSHFRDVILRDHRAPIALIEKFPHLASRCQEPIGNTDHSSSQPPDPQVLVHENSGSTDMIEELLHAPYDVNFNLLEDSLTIEDIENILVSRERKRRGRR